MKIFALIIYCLILKESINKIIPFDLQNGIKYIGVNDHYEHYHATIEGPNPVPNGAAYNSYVIIDDKILIIDGIHEFYQKIWLENLQRALEGRKPDFLLIQHMEPDHSDNILDVLKLYPDIKIVASSTAFKMMENYLNFDLSKNSLVVKEGDKLELGNHILNFIEAPMVHWPEVIITYDSLTKTLFTSDSFGKFGANDIDEPWEDEARRFYFGILGKFGQHVQFLIQKISKLEIKNIFPSHGQILTENIPYYISFYDKWSKYIPEEKGVVIVYSSVYGHTKEAVDKLSEKLKSLGIKYIIYNVSTNHWTKMLSDTFRYNSLILASVMIDDDISPAMREFIEIILSFNYQNRKVGFMENGSWNRRGNKIMKSMLKDCKNLSFYKNEVSIDISLDENSISQINNLKNEIFKN